MKKKILMLLTMLTAMLYTNTVFAKDIYSCEKSLSGVLIDARIPEIVSTIIVVIKIVVPILLVILGMIDLVKGLVASKEDEIKKGQGIFIKRLIAGALVFFVVTIVQLVISFAVGDEDEESDMMTCVQCFINGDCTYRTKSNGACPSGTKKSNNGNYCVDK